MCCSSIDDLGGGMGGADLLNCHCRSSTFFPRHISRADLNSFLDTGVLYPLPTACFLLAFFFVPIDPPCVPVTI